MEKMKMHSMCKIDENVKKIATLFPECITETLMPNSGGGGYKLTKVVDFDILKQIFSKTAVEGNKERYQFTWPDKRKARAIVNQEVNSSLRPCREESVNFDTTENLYIEGDNLEVLKLLQETYLGKIKMIYIDPPYNTGHDFVYEDDFSQNATEYSSNSGQYDDQGNRLVENTESNGRFHTNWLNMMYPRLLLAKDLLSDDGVIFISIDDNEIDSLKNICNEIFGQSNMVAEIPWQSRASVQNDTDFSVNHEYICVYAKRRRQENRRLKESNYKEWHNKDSFVCKPLPLDRSKFDNPDNDPRGLWKADPFDAPNVRPNLTYIVTNPQTGEQHLPPRGRHWRISQDKFSSALNAGRIIFGKNGTGRPQMKSFYEEKKELGSIDNSWFSAERVGTTTNGTKEVMQLFDDKPFFDKPKPTTLLYKLINLANVQSNDFVLDFFSGSATTAHAVMKLNSEDGGHRKFIMVQLPEKCDEKTEAYKAGYKNICEIGKERIRRAGKQILEEMKTKNGDLFAEETSLDIGFRDLKLDSSNMKDVYYTPDSLDKDMLDGLISNIKEDRTPEDLLFQVMLDLGVLLSAKITEEEIDGKKVFNVDDNYLIACFDNDVNENVIIEIAKKKPTYFVMRDSSLANDSVSVNFDQFFARYSPDTVRKVL